MPVSVTTLGENIDINRITAKLIPNKVEELESIRGLAALLIVLFHIPSWNAHFYDYNFIRNGYLMVELFFVLSGYVIYSAYSNKISNKIELLRFQFLRFGRLYPVHLLYLGIFLFVEVVKYIAQNKFGIFSPNTQAFRENNLIALIQNIFLLQAIGPTGNATTFNYPSWSISVEFYTYLLFGLIVLLSNKIKNRVFFVICLISLILLMTQNTFGFGELLRCYAGFFLGCLTANFKQHNERLLLPPLLPLLSFLGLIIFLIVKINTHFDFIIYFLTQSLILGIVMTDKNVVKSLFNIKIFKWLGSISYSMYMSHAIIIWITNQLFRVVLKKPELIIGGKSTPVLSFMETMGAYIFVLSIVFIVSVIVCRLIEKPFRLKSRKIVLNN